jgi:hypothetical protein
MFRRNISPPPSGSKIRQTSVISQKIELFVPTAVRASDPKGKWFVSSDINHNIIYYILK